MKMAPPADGHREESSVAGATIGVAGPPAGTDHGPHRVDKVTIDVAVSDGAAAVEITPRMASPNPVVRGGDDEIVPVDGGCPAAAAVSLQVVVPEVTVAMDPLEELIERERQRAEEIQEAGGNEEQPCIWRVHPSIREQDSEAYEPKLVSIGPLHRTNGSLQPMEDIKLKYLSKLLSRSPDTNKLSNYIRVIRECEPRAREQYAEKIELDTDEFVRMLVLDGCFIIEYFVKRVFKETRQTSQLSGVRWGFSHLRRDLMLLENQIPFFVLVRLFDQSKIPFRGNRPEPLTLVEITLKFLEVDQLPEGRQLHVDQVRHLLHLHHMCLDPSGPEPPRHCSCGQVVLCPFKTATRLVSMLFFGLLYLVLSHKLPRCCSPTEESEAPRMIPCATELHQAGVKFRKKDGVSSFLKVSFTEGKLEIPFLSVQESTSSKLRNFIALEQCCPLLGSHFTSYAVFVDNIINTGGDVAILQKRGIIESKLGSEEEVAKMFNTLCKGTHLHYRTHYNAPLFKAVKEYCEVPHHRWRATLKSTHLSSPWSTISLVAAILIFGLAITQAYFNISRRRKK